VRASDNLRDAELVLVVEGEDDRIAISALLKEHFPFLKDAIETGLLALDTLSGASNLSYKITEIRASICLRHVFLDYDKSGIEAFRVAKSRGLIEDRDANFARCPALNESELEDLYDLSIYDSLVQTKFRVFLQSPKFRANKKWSVRLRDCFVQQGKDWNDETEYDVKLAVARAVVANPEHALNAHKREAFISLGRSLEERLKEREKATQELQVHA